MLFFSISPEVESQIWKYIESSAKEVRPQDSVDGLGIVYATDQTTTLTQIRKISRHITHRVLHNLIHDVVAARPTALCAHIRVRYHDSPDVYPHKHPYFHNVEVLQPVMFHPFTMAFKGQIVGFTDPEIRRRIRANIDPKYPLTGLSDAELVFFMILTYSKKPTLRNMKTAVMQTLQWFETHNIRLVLYIIFMTSKYAVITSRNTGLLYISPDTMTVASHCISPDCYTLPRDSILSVNIKTRRIAIE